ncbi:CDP-alcohol phosphatidyltransferase-domain-containing protein [Xylaria bambusicola]|uniref:CDP-alcohol phosphatidyltransferase-domain-containing protein n=1 Tax=Xylaria bambusicola TaxID=326684 RepID=UPI002007DCC7|nr:CDP-alcohol phosphatidyltransferase-domain-containing protein [Xylaria bambusicola]KAI0526359.1 CDP-alcohol phosphatidyltransferase-domain-containing protein [Xylaria bambusicola]
MLTYRSATATSPLAQSFLRGAYDAARHTGCSKLLKCPVRFDSAPAKISSLSIVARARKGPFVPGDAPTYRANGVKSQSFRDKFAATDSLRFLSNTTARYFAKGQDEGRGSPSAQQISSASQPQPQPKGIRKVLPSLTAHENIYTVPNILTFSRLVAAPFIGYAILHDAHTLALGLFAYAGVSDLLDGWIARRWKLQTVVGSVVDPMADKLLMTVLTVCLAMQGSLPVWLATIILGRDVGLGISAIYYRWISLPPPKTFTRYWDFSLPSAEVRPTTISKYNTFLQLGLMGATMVVPVVAVEAGSAMTVFQYLVATTTVWSGLSYVFSKDAVRILSENKERKPKDP